MTTKEALWKDIWKTIWTNKARFFALFAIIFLGVGFFAGIRATGPDMLQTAENYYQKTNHFDLRVVSTYGIESLDENAIAKVDDIEIEAVQTVDVLMEGDHYLTRLFPTKANESNQVNYAVVDGRLPNKKGEIALDAALDGYSIGEVITFVQPEEEGITFSSSSYEIVGFVNAPFFIEELTRGTSSVGKGTLDAFGVVMEEELSGEIATELYVRFTGEEVPPAYSAAYLDLVDQKKEELELALNGRPLKRIQEIKTEAQREIFNGEKKLEDAKKALEEAAAKIEANEADLVDARETYNEQVSIAEAEFAQAEAKLQQEEKTLAEVFASYEAGVTEWEAGAHTYADEKAAWDIQRGTYLSITDGELTLEQLAENPLPTEEGQVLADEIHALFKAEAEVQQARNQFNGYIETLKAQEQQILDAENQLAADRQTVATLVATIEERMTSLGTDRATYDARVAQVQTIEQFLTKPLAQWTEPEREARVAAIQAQGNVSTVFQSFLNYVAGTGTLEEIPIEAEKAEQQRILRELEVIAQLQAQVEAFQIQTREDGLFEESRSLEQAKQSLGQNVAQLDAADAQLAEGRRRIEQEVQGAVVAIGTQIREVDLLFSQQGVELEAARAELEAAYSELAYGETQLAAARAQLASERATADASLQDALHQLEDGERALAEGKEEFEQERQKAEPEIAKAEEELEAARTEWNELETPVYYVQDRSILPGYEGYGDNANRITAIAAIFPVFFFFIAALVSFTTMTRMVDEQRQQLGTLKALGYQNFDIAKKFLVYAGLASIVATATGLLVGYNLFPSLIYFAYRALYNLPDLEIRYYPSYALVSLLVAILCTVGPAILATRRSLREQPSSLLRPRAPKNGKRVILERIPFIWNRLNFNAKITVRNLVRYKARNLMTVIGVAGCMALILTGFALNNSISGLANTQFDELMKYDAIVTFQEDATNEQMSSYEETVASFKEVRQELPIRLESYRARKAGISNQDVTLFVASDPTRMESLVTLRDRNTLEAKQIESKGAVVTEKLALLLDVQPGDELTIENDLEESFAIPVTEITENYTGHYLYVSKESYEEIFSTSYESNASIIQYEVTKSFENRFAETLMQEEAVAMITFMDQVDQAFSDTLDSLDIITLVLIISAAALAFVVLYNLTNINVSERIRELSTIKVLGFYPKEVSMYIYRETLILTSIGILLGFVVGNILATILLKMVEVDFMLFPIVIKPISYVLSAALTLTFSSLVMILLHQRLKRVDMLEALKSVE